MEEFHFYLMMLTLYWMGLFTYYIFQRFFKVRNKNTAVTIVWLDRTCCSSGIYSNNAEDENQNIAKFINSALTIIKHLNVDRVMTFTSSDDCVSYITSLKNTNRPVCLITSGSLGISVIPLVHNIDQVESIIVFCMKKSKYRFMQKRYDKIRDVVNTPQELLLQLQITLKFIDQTGAIINIFSIEDLKQLRQLNLTYDPPHLTYTIFDENKLCSMRDISKADAFFLWLKLITSVLQKVHHTSETMDEMLEQCRDYYKDNPAELSKINEFKQTYRKDKAIFWYTTPTFVSKLVNKALRTEDFQALYICRAFIADLSEQLHTEYEEYKQLLIEFNQPLAQWIVYHGRTMSQEEIDVFRTKKGQLISLNGFLSTSRKKEVAEFYSKEVIFQIQTTFDLSHGCFAHVAPLSQIPEEDEVLFGLASVFKIVDITHDSLTDKWCIDLITTDEGTNMVQAYIDSARNEANETNVDFILVRLLVQMGEYRLAHDYLTKLTRIISTEEETRDRALIYYYKGLNYYSEGNYSQSMEEYEKALAIQRKIFPDGHSDLSETLGGIGLLHDSIGNYELALKNHLDGLIIMEKIFPRDHMHTARIFNYLGLSYVRKDQFELALEYNTRALKMKKRLVYRNHPDIARSLNSVGFVYYNHSDYGNALDYYQQALVMKEQVLPFDHPESAISYSNLGLVHLALDHHEEALIYFMRCLAMSERTLPPDHAQIGITHCNLGRAYRAHVKGSDLSLKHYRRSIKIYMKSLPRQHPYIGLSLMYIAEVLYDQDKLLEAQECGQEAFGILKLAYGDGHRRLAESAYILAKICKKTNRNDQALEYACKARDIQLKTLTTDHKDVRKTLELIESMAM